MRKIWWLYGKRRTPKAIRRKDMPLKMNGKSDGRKQEISRSIFVILNG